MTEVQYFISLPCLLNNVCYIKKHKNRCLKGNVNNQDINLSVINLILIKGVDPLKLTHIECYITLLWNNVTVVFELQLHHPYMP